MSIRSVIQIASNLYPQHNIVNIFGNWLHGVDHSFRIIIMVRDFAIIWSLWLWINDKIFNDKNVTCSLSTGVQHYFMHSRLYNVWRIVIYLWRWIHSWRTWLEIFLPMDEVFGLVLHYLGKFTVLITYIGTFFVLLFLDLSGRVHINYAEAGCNI
jgi:hypothetical protein